MNAWWTAQEAGLIGGVGGAGIGLMGALAGSLSFLAVRGKAKPLIVGLYGTMIVVGMALVAAGVVAVVQGQPHHVRSPLFIGGLIATSIFGPLFPVVLMRYRQAEVRKLEAEQLRRA